MTPNLQPSVFYLSAWALTLLCRNGDIHLANVCLHSGAKINMACGNLKRTPLLLAAYNRDVQMVKFLLQAGASPDVMDQWNYTPLMYAAIHNDPNEVEQMFVELVRADSDVNFGATLNNSSESEVDGRASDLPAIDHFSDGMYITYVREPLGAVSGTALHMAVQNPNLPSDVVEILLRAGADVNAKNLYGHTPLFGPLLDIYYDFHCNIQSHTELLLKHGADVNVGDCRGWTPCHYVAQRGSTACIELLLRAGADANATSVKGETVLWILLANGWRQPAKYLLQNGCNFDQPIHSEVIMELNQQISLCRHGYISPFEFAVCNKLYDVATLLLECGCEVSSSTCVGRTDRAFDSGHEKLLATIADKQLEQRCVKSLSACCRTTIRAFLQSAIVIKLENVCLPEPLANFLCLK